MAILFWKVIGFDDANFFSGSECPKAGGIAAT
jgi:hypothetical protein